MEVKKIIEIMEQFAPPAVAESYDNVGLLVGNANMQVTGILLTMDVVETVLDEAIEGGLNMIISHHPLIFRPLKSITGSSAVERVVIKAIKNNIAIYAAHTNADMIQGGVSHALAKVLGLKHTKVLHPIKANMHKLVIYTPFDYANDVRQALADAGAGELGLYDCCSFSSVGEGRFRPSENANPAAGEPGSVYTEKEEKIEAIVQSYKLKETIAAVRKAHPYQEVVYEVICLHNNNNRIGLGVCGELSETMEFYDFLSFIKDKLNVVNIRHNEPINYFIRKVAICGGSGASLMGDAICKGADIYITGDVKYHDFVDAANNIILCDIGHFESERVILDVFYEVLTKKITNFAVRKSTTFNNPIITT